MVETIIQYTGEYLKDKITFLDVVNAPVKRLTNGVIYKNDDSQKTNVSISDDVGYGVYIRQTAPESVAELPLKTSMGNEYKISSRCRLVFYSFKTDHSEEKVKSILISNLGGVRFPRYIGTSYSFKIIINNVSTDFEKIYLEERGGNYTGDNWPTIIAIDFTITYEDKNCNVCDLAPELNCFELPPSQQFPSSSGEPGKTFCDRVAECPVIEVLQTRVIELQNEIDNISGGGLTCDDLSTCTIIADIQTAIDEIELLLNNYITQNDIDVLGLQTDVATLQNDLSTLILNLNNHVSDLNNPHQTTLDQARAADNFFTGEVDMNNNRLRNLPAPVNADEATNKAYVDGLIDNTLKAAEAYNPNITNLFPVTYNGNAIQKGDTFRLSAGTMNGVVVDNEDLLIADIDAPGQIVGNWQILESNREQATESIKGIAKMATQIDVEDEMTSNNTDIVTPQKFWFGILKFISLAWTWAAKQTFTTAPRFSSANASEYLKTDGSKDLTSVSAIPKADVGLGNVDNTSDANKPVSTAQQTALDLKLPIEAPSTNGVALTFLTDRVYGTIGIPETGDITYDATGAKLGVTNIIIHNHSVAPTFGANMKKLSGSGNYVLNVVNYIYVTYINSTEVIYAINQRT